MKSLFQVYWRMILENAGIIWAATTALTISSGRNGTNPMLKASAIPSLFMYISQNIPTKSTSSAPMMETIV